MPQVVFPLDSSKKFTDQKIVGHNRWHPDIPAQVKVKPGDSFRADVREWFEPRVDGRRDAPTVPKTKVPRRLIEHTV